MIAWSILALGILLAVGLFGLRSYVTGPPAFVIEHRVQFAGSRAAAWEALTNSEEFAEWNPYVQSIAGEMRVGGRLRVKITQDNWPRPIVVRPYIQRLEPEKLLHWHGRILIPGFLETDHSFAFRDLENGQIELIQREEFRGWLAYRMKDHPSQRHTFAAFERMDLALAARVSAISNLQESSGSAKAR